MKEKIKTSSYGLLNELALLVECLAPGQNCIAALYAKKAICTPKLQWLVHCCCYIQLHVVLKKRNNILHSPFAFKQTVKISVFSFVLFSDSFSLKFSPQLGCDYESFAFLVYG